MRPAILAILVVLPCAAQIFPSWTIADTCGGQPGWISGTTIVEESAAVPSGGGCTYNTKTPYGVIYDVKSISYSGSWGSQTNLTSALRPGTIATDCSAGDPSSDGTNLVFIVQNAGGNCATSSETPSGGVEYDLWGCSATSGLTSTNCGKLVTVQTGTGLMLGAILDPHIDGNYVYVSERNPVGVSVSWNTWFIDVVPVTWGNPPTAGTVVRYAPGSWTGYEATNPCEQYYKASSFQHLTNGNTRIFTQANQVANYPNPAMPANCTAIGRNGFIQSGLFYFDLTGAPSGSNFTQIYPPASTPNTPNCFTPDPPAPTAIVTACYGEFPLIFPNGGHLFMTFTGQTATPASLIDLCTTTAGCQSNYTQEELAMDLGTDTQNPAPAGIVREMDSQIPGTALNTAFITGGLPAGHFGGCGHPEINVSTAQLVCAFNTNIKVGGVNQDRTVVFPLQYPGSLLYPKTTINGNTKLSGNIQVN